MANEFLGTYRMLNSNRAASEQLAYNKIMEDVVFKKDKVVKQENIQYDPITWLPTQNSESETEKRSKDKMLPGNIYIFNYKSQKDVVVENSDGSAMQLTDKLPCVFVLSVSGSNIKGINLNLCRSEVKALWLNGVLNANSVFKGKYDTELHNNTRKLVMNGDTTQLMDTLFSYEIHLDADYKKAVTQCLSSCCRQYDMNNSTNVRLVEPWLWKYIPFLGMKAYNKVQAFIFNKGLRKI